MFVDNSHCSAANPESPKEESRFSPTKQKSVAKDSSSSETALDSLTEIFHPPSHFKFPKRVFGAAKKRERSCSALIFQEFPWLTYITESDVVLCHPCMTAQRKKLTKFEKREKDAFSSVGFSDWNDWKRKVTRHGSSRSHSEAVLAVNKSYSKAPVNELLDQGVVTNKSNNTYMLTEVVKVVKHLARQNLPLRGATKPVAESGDHSEPDSHLWQSLLLLGHKDPKLEMLLKMKQTFTSPSIQNELLKIMSNNIVRNIADQIRACKYYSIMVDETSDITNQEQATICIRYVKDLECHEEFLGLYAIDDTTSETLFKIVLDVLLRLNLSLDNCRGQCYDGASAMSGKRKGLKTLIQQKNPKALYVHCYAHTLSLAMNDTFKLEPKMSAMLDICFEICKLIKKSPKRETLLKKVKAESLDTTNGLRVLCPTRWTVRAASLRSILDNYGHLQDVWLQTLDGKVDSEMRTRIGGVQWQMKSFEMFFTMNLGSLILGQTDNLSRALQATHLAAGNMSSLAEVVLNYFRSKRSEEEFNKFYDVVLEAKEKAGT